MKNLNQICEETFNGIIVNEDAVLVAAKENAAELICKNSLYIELIEASKETEQVEDLFSGNIETVRTESAEAAWQQARELFLETAYEMANESISNFYGEEKCGEPVDGLNEQRAA